MLPLIAWGYHQQFAKWNAVLDRFERNNIRIANPVPVLRWNGDKSYLAELHSKGVSTVPSLAFETLDESALDRARATFDTAELVVKPLVS